MRRRAGYCSYPHVSQHPVCSVQINGGEADVVGGWGRGRRSKVRLRSTRPAATDKTGW